MSTDRKNQSYWTGSLNVKIWLLGNLVLKLDDASGALANRFIPIKMKRSFLGKEDHGLLARILPERAAILNWALEGYRRLTGC